VGEGGKGGRESQTMARGGGWRFTARRRIRFEKERGADSKRKNLTSHLWRIG